VQARNATYARPYVSACGGPPYARNPESRDFDEHLGRGPLGLGVCYNVGMPRPTVFVSYSHKDEKWKNRLLPALQVLVQQDLFDVWEDRRIAGGDSWYPEIQTAMARAEAAVCLISANYLSSSFVLQEEFLISRAAREEGAPAPPGTPLVLLMAPGRLAEADSDAPTGR
jgi:hypothetical protein